MSLHFFPAAKRMSGSNWIFRELKRKSIPSTSGLAEISRALGLPTMMVNWKFQPLEAKSFWLKIREPSFRKIKNRWLHKIFSPVLDYSTPKTVMNNLISIRLLPGKRLKERIFTCWSLLETLPLQKSSRARRSAIQPECFLNNWGAELSIGG